MCAVVRSRQIEPPYGEEVVGVVGLRDLRLRILKGLYDPLSGRCTRSW